MGRRPARLAIQPEAIGPTHALQDRGGESPAALRSPWATSKRSDSPRYASPKICRTSSPWPRAVLRPFRPARAGGTTLTVREPFPAGREFYASRAEQEIDASKIPPRSQYRRG